MFGDDVTDNQNVVAKALPGLRSQDGSTGQTGTGTSVTLDCSASGAIVSAAQNQRATEGAWSGARRRWQEGTVYLRQSKSRPAVVGHGDETGSRTGHHTGL